MIKVSEGQTAQLTCNATGKGSTMGWARRRGGKAALGRKGPGTWPTAPAPLLSLKGVSTSWPPHQVPHSSALAISLSHSSCTLLKHMWEANAFPHTSPLALGRRFQVHQRIGIQRPHLGPAERGMMINRWCLPWVQLQQR
jgi:hypothetical protein